MEAVTYQEKEQISDRRTWRGEAALAIAVVINSFGVVLMLYAGSGISAVSSVPYAFSRVFDDLTLGTWTYIFQGFLVAWLMILRKRFVPQYMFSFVVGFIFGELIDFYELWINILPQTIVCRFIYFAASFILFSIGIALSNRCGLPIIPTDLFTRELADITGVAYTRIKIVFDVMCLAATASLTFFCLGHVDGLGIGTVIAAFTLGKAVGIAGSKMDKSLQFTTFLAKRQLRKAR